jgi:hypothetical protein
MFELTNPKCGECRLPHSCCSNDYCEAAMEFADEQGIKLERTNHPTLLFMGENGCTVPPHLRPLCTVFECSINSMGISKDQFWDEKYWTLRELIDQMMDKENIQP